MNTSIKFSYNGYRDLLKKIKKKRKSIFFKDYKISKKPFVIIRHDIEYFVEAALMLAKIEKSLGMKSTFFFLLTSSYNIFSERNIFLIQKIKKMGHSFGIHYDPVIIDQNRLNFNDNLNKQISLFESFFKVKIQSISCHRPKVKFSEYKDKTIFNVYDKSFQKSVKYFSDSQQVFRENVDELINSNKNLHLLIHDYTWSNQNRKWEDNIIKYFKKNVKEEERYYRKIIKEWQIGLKLRKKRDAIFKKKVLNQL